MQSARRKSKKKNLKGKRKCNCKSETKMKNVGGGRFAMYEDEKCDWCPRVKYENVIWAWILTVGNCCFKHLIVEFPFRKICVFLAEY